MNGSGARHKHSSGGLTKSKRTVSKPDLVAIQAECFYGLDEQRIDGTEDTRPVLVRYLRCRAVLPPDVPLQNASRVIAMLKCFRKIAPTTKQNGSAATPMIETLFSKFSRVWPIPTERTASDYGDSAALSQSALVVHDQTSAIDFKIFLLPDLPQSISIAGGSIYYTLQIQANMRHPSNISSEEAIYSKELTIDVPAPEGAYSASRLPKRITHGVVGQAQEHYGILITPDISLHVSVPREISYSKRIHSVFKIHIKLMPHPPEAKLPAISRMEWRLTQKTNLGSVQLDGNHESRRIGISTAVIASGQVLLNPSLNDAAADSAAMSGSRKDQYLYIALPENSPMLMPMYDGNRYLEILHNLEIELFPFTDPAKNSSGFGRSAASFFNKAFTRRKTTATLPWKADVPITIYFDPAELFKTPNSASLQPDRLAIQAQ